MISGLIGVVVGAVGMGVYTHFFSKKVVAAVSTEIGKIKAKL